MIRFGLFPRLCLGFAALLSVTAFASPEPYRISDFRWVVAPSSSFGEKLAPAGIPIESSNNTVSITLFQGKLFMAWRSAPTHFASSKTVMYVASSSDFGVSWEKETELKMDTDIREPFFLELGGKLFFYCFQAGDKALQFTPRHTMRIERLAQGKWTEPMVLGRPGEIAWDYKIRDGVAYRTSYAGSHYSVKPGEVDVYFTRSTDGVIWTPVGKPVVYTGGVSETSFEFDLKGDLYASTRNEDGDESGWGSHFVSAPAASPGDWQFPAKSYAERYDSPRMFRHKGELYLIARRDVGGPFDRGMRWLPFNVQRWLYLGEYSARPKRTSLYYVNREERRFDWMEDLPSAGDNAFPSVIQLSENRFLIANYSSPLQRDGWTWIQGQTSREGTGIYWVELNF